MLRPSKPCFQLVTMPPTVQSKWHWETVDPGRTGASGDLSKMFKNETVKAPGVFSANAPDADAALLIREVIQNSWDAAIETRESSTAHEITPFEVQFRFVSVSGPTREALVEHLGLRELAARAESVGNQQGLGLGENNCLGDLGRDDDLRLLEITEQASGGMHGPWKGDASKLYLALCSIGITSEKTGRGGSYGYGKAGLIRGSAIRSVIAYTCFEERPDDPGVSRRLLGMTYWDRHRLSDISYTGSARMGDTSGGSAVPFEN